MKLRHIITLSLVFLFLFSALDSDAQRRRRGGGRNKYAKRKVRSKSISNYRGGSVGGKFRPYSFLVGNVNALNYYGDLAPLAKASSTDISWTRPGMGVNVGNRFNPHLAVRAGFNYGRVKGDDISSDPTTNADGPRYYRNLSFRNDIKEFHLAFEYYFKPNFGGPNVRPPLNIYLFAGGAVFHHEPKGKVPELDYTTGGTIKAPQAGDWVSLRKLGTEGQYIKGVGVSQQYSPIQFSVPFGLGVKMRLAGPFDVGMEIGYRYLFTDYIDDVSSNYVSFDHFDNPLARIMSDRSAEQVGVLTGLRRELPVSSQVLTDGNTYYSVSGDYAIGGGLAEGAKRGNPHNADAIIMTTIKLTYIVGKNTRRTAKFR